MASERMEQRLAAVGIGPQRTGSSWLWVCLREHPDLAFPSGTKETQFLDERFHEGWAWYWSYFRDRQPGQRCAEICPTYFDVPDAAARLHAHAPDCRLIVTLRDPADRAFSLYLHERKKVRVNGEFGGAVARMPRLVEASRYARHLPRWLELFGRERVLVLLLDDIAVYPAQVLERVSAFLGIRSVPPPPAAFEPINVAMLPALPPLARVGELLAARLRARRMYAPIELAKRLGLKRRLFGGAPGGVPSIDRETRARLVGEFEPDIAYVEALLDRPLPGWRAVG